LVQCFHLSYFVTLRSHSTRDVPDCENALDVKFVAYCKKTTFLIYRSKIPCKRNFTTLVNHCVTSQLMWKLHLITEKSSGRIYILMEARLCELYKSGAEYEILERSQLFNIMFVVFVW